jgi:hypothetical protein
MKSRFAQPVRRCIQIAGDGYQTVISIKIIRKDDGTERYVLPFRLAGLLLAFCCFGLCGVIMFLEEAASLSVTVWEAVRCSIPVILLIWSVFRLVRVAVWRSKGKETITIVPHQLTIQYDADPWKRKKDYELRYIQSVDVGIHPATPEKLRPIIDWWIRFTRVWKHTALCFRYKDKPVRFGREITRADAEMIRDAINKKLNAIA